MKRCGDYGKLEKLMKCKYQMNEYQNEECSKSQRSDLQKGSIVNPGRVRKIYGNFANLRNQYGNCTKKILLVENEKTKDHR